MRGYWYTAILCGSVVIIMAVHAFADLGKSVNGPAAASGWSAEGLEQSNPAPAAGKESTGAADGNGGETASGTSKADGEGGQDESTIAAGEQRTVNAVAGGQGTGAGNAGGLDRKASGHGGETGPEAAGKGGGPDTAAADSGSDSGSDLPQAANESQSGASKADQNFSGVLFIGDSRTVGLSEYGNLGEAMVFASSGMSVYNLFQTEVKFADEGKKKLEAVLAERSYRTIYLMLGINELGYDYGRTVKQYQAVVDKIKEMEPGALLVLEANLHVTKEKASMGSIFNNDKINAFNQAVAGIAREEGCLYLDVNGLFDDPEGNLEAKYSTDGAHVLGKYYKDWSDWLRKNQPDS